MKNNTLIKTTLIIASAFALTAAAVRAQSTPAESAEASWAALGLQKFQCGADVAAIDAYEKAIAINPHVFAYYDYVVRSYADENDFKDAEATLRLAEPVALASQDPEDIFTLAKGFAVANAPSNAVRVCNWYLGLNPKGCTAWKVMGNELMELGRQSEALKAYDRAAHCGDVEAIVYGRTLRDKLYPQIAQNGSAPSQQNSITTNYNRLMTIQRYCPQALHNP